MFNTILVVCTGNICRSPIAERILRQKFPLKKVDSAGVGALVDYPADKVAIYTAEKHGLSLEGHKARQFNSQIARDYDLILVMEKEHLERVTSISPEARGKTMLLGHWNGQKAIPDPYKKSNEAFEYVYNLIEVSCENWAKRI